MAILTKEQKDLLADFLESIRDYERESHNLIGFDERETSEFVEIYEGLLCNRNNYSDTESGKALHNINDSIPAKAERTLNVKKVTKTEVEQKWGYQLPVMWGNTLYMRCNAKGEVNWGKAPLYQAVELVERGNYVIHE